VKKKIKVFLNVVISKFQQVVVRLFMYTYDEIIKLYCKVLEMIYYIRKLFFKWLN